MNTNNLKRKFLFLSKGGEQQGGESSVYKIAAVEKKRKKRDIKVQIHNLKHFLLLMEADDDNDDDDKDFANNEGDGDDVLEREVEEHVKLDVKMVSFFFLTCYCFFHLISIVPIMSISNSHCRRFSFLDGH